MTPSNPYEGTGSAGNNLAERRDKAAKKGQCQWCHTKVPLDKQFVVFIDWDANGGKGEAKKMKDASKPSRSKLSHYCGPDHNDCAGKRLKMKQSALLRREGKGVRGGGSGGSSKPSRKRGGSKAKAKAPAKAKAKAAPKRKVVKRKVVKRKAKATAAKAPADPF